MNPNEVYDYTTAGFDGFLSRSIDGLTQTNLDAESPVNNQIRYDFSQVTGKQGDVWRIGAVRINAEGITVAEPGVKVEQAADDQIIFDTSTNNLKIVKVFEDDYTFTDADITAQKADFKFSHGLGVTPELIVTKMRRKLGRDGEVKYREALLPFMFLNTSTGAFGGDVRSGLTARVLFWDENFVYLRIDIESVVGLSMILSFPDFYFTFYVLSQSNPDD